MMINAKQLAITARGAAGIWLAITGTAVAQNVPPHQVVDDAALLQGRRIEIHSDDPRLSRDACVALLDHYRARAGGGQVSVNKPSTFPGMDGAVLPYCVDNLDGSGPVFHDDFHPE